MKNITVSVEDEVYHRARVRAAERRTSVSAIVRRVLVDLAAEESRVERLKRQEEAVIAGLGKRGCGFVAGNRLSREEVHARDVVR